MFVKLLFIRFWNFSEVRVNFRLDSFQMKPSEPEKKAQFTAVSTRIFQIVSPDICWWKWWSKGTVHELLPRPTVPAGMVQSPLVCVSVDWQTNLGLQGGGKQPILKRSCFAPDWKKHKEFNKLNCFAPETTWVGLQGGGKATYFETKWFRAWPEILIRSKPTLPPTPSPVNQLKLLH